MFAEVWQAIRRYDTIVIHRHANPDGDAIGSQVGLAGLIHDNCPDKRIYLVGDPTTRYAFVAGYRLDDIPDEVYRDALAIVLDSATPALVADSRYAVAACSARLDHHIYCGTFCDIEVVDSTYESCAGMVADLAREQNLALSPSTANAIFTGIVTDSGRFRYDSTNARTFALASMLLQHGADPAPLYRALYQSALADEQRKALFVQRIQMYPNSPIAYLYNSAAWLKEKGLDDIFAVSRGMVGVMADLKGVDIWVNFTENEKEGCVWVELRSSIYNINPIAVRYGGGGHARASGASVPDHATAMRMLADLKQLTESHE